MAGGLIKPKKQLQRDQSLDPIQHISQPASTILRRIRRPMWSAHLHRPTPSHLWWI